MWTPQTPIRRLLTLYPSYRALAMGRSHYKTCLVLSRRKGVTQDGGFPAWVKEQKTMQCQGE